MVLSLSNLWNLPNKIAIENYLHKTFEISKSGLQKETFQLHSFWCKEVVDYHHQIQKPFMT